MMLENLPVNFWTSSFWLILQNSPKFPQNFPEIPRISPEFPQNFPRNPQIMKWKGKYCLWCQKILPNWLQLLLRCRKQCWRYLIGQVQTSLDKFGLDQNSIKTHRTLKWKAIIVEWCQKILWILLPCNVKDTWYFNMTEKWKPNLLYSAYYIPNGDNVGSTNKP